MTNTLDTINKWHQKARPAPDARAFNVQLGCHLEEVAEMLDTLKIKADVFGQDTTVPALLFSLATALKTGDVAADITDREALLDSLADQIVTAVGVGHCAGMDVPCATEIVDRSNWSKFVDGEPVFDANGKIAKPDTYQAPNLRGLY